jgi:hypothetical protein
MADDLLRLHRFYAEEVKSVRDALHDIERINSRESQGKACLMRRHLERLLDVSWIDRCRQLVNEGRAINTNETRETGDDSDNDDDEEEEDDDASEDDMEMPDRSLLSELVSAD